MTLVIRNNNQASRESSMTCKPETPSFDKPIHNRHSIELFKYTCSIYSRT